MESSCNHSPIIMTSTTGARSNSNSFSDNLMRKAKSMDSIQHLFPVCKFSELKGTIDQTPTSRGKDLTQIHKKASRFSSSNHAPTSQRQGIILLQQQQEHCNLQQQQQQQQHQHHKWCAKWISSPTPELDSSEKSFHNLKSPSSPKEGYFFLEDSSRLNHGSDTLQNRRKHPKQASSLDTVNAAGYPLTMYHRPFSSSSHLSTSSVSRPTSVVSLASLDLQMQEPTEQMAMAGPIAALRELFSGQGRNIRLGPLIHLVIFSCLLFGTLSDVFIRINHYTSDENSSTVSSGRTNKMGHGFKKPKSRVLGSAMIGSITEVLSPILPFAGGVDLRRDDKWKSFKNYLWIFGDKQQQNQTLNSMGHKVSLLPRGGSLGKKKHGPGSDSSSSRTHMILSATEPFLSTKDIADMTLRDVSFAFRYIIEAGRKDFQLKSFLSRGFEGEPVNDRMEKIVHSIEDAVEKSRGIDILPASTSVEYDLDNIVDLKGPLSSTGYGDIDALRFCAAMRILAEWRLLRQVPPGYKGYAVGMSLGHKDVVQNVAKIESAAHEWIEAQSIEEARCDEDEICNQRRSPTLRQLLLHEIDRDIHPNHKLPRLKEKSSAMGLLWVRRQLHYQTSIFDNIISVPKKFPSVIDAVSAAYTEVYGKLHGWAVQKIFNYSFQSAPSAEDIYRHMNPHRLEQIKAALRNGAIAPYSTAIKRNETPKKEIIRLDSIPDLAPLDFDDESIVSNVEIVEEVPTIEGSNKAKGNDIVDFFKQVGHEIDTLGRNIGSMWDETLCNFSNIIKNDNEKDDCENRSNSLNTRGGGRGVGSKPTNAGLSDEEMEEYVTNEMKQDAKEHILAYLNIARPMLTDLAGLFDEMNMDDPTKV